VEKVDDRGSFPQELGIDRDRERTARLAALGSQKMSELLARLHRHSAADDNQV
jgi:hypothetical protein